MEPVSIPAQRGTLEDPEVLQNVPGHVIPILQREYDDFKTESTQVPGRRYARGRVHQVPPEAGRVRPAPGRRADDPREAAVRRGHAGADGELRRRDREVRAAEQGPRHHAAEHPDAPHAADGSREGDPRDRRDRAVQPRGLRQHDAQRDGRPVGGRGEGRAVRPDALRGRLRALLRAPPDHPGDAAQGQDVVRRQPARPRDLRHPRRRVPRSRARDRRAARARCAASRCWSAAAPRSCPARRRCCTTSSSSTTANT